MANANTRTTKTAKPAAKPALVKPNIHPAEQAGMVVHQRVEDGVVAVGHALSTAGKYVFGFAKGLVKGH